MNLYKVEIVKFLMIKEKSDRRRDGYLYNTPFTSDTRANSVEWILETGRTYRVEDETVHLAVSLMDTFLSVTESKDPKLQITTAAAFLIACKYEEVQKIETKDLVYVLEDASLDDLLSKEREILQSLNFSVKETTTYSLMTLLYSFLSENEVIFYLASYYCELSLLADSSLRFSSSTLAGASLALAQFVMDIEDHWPETLIVKFQLDPHEVQDGVLHLISLVNEAHRIPQTSVVMRKFKKSNYCAVSQMKTPRNYINRIV